MFDVLKNALSGLFGNANERELKKLWPYVDEINAASEGLQDLSDDELRGKTEAFKKEIREAVEPIEQRQKEIIAQLKGRPLPADAQGDGAPPAEPEELSYEDRQALQEEYDSLDDEWLEVVEEVLDDLLPEAFAVMKETCRRFVGKSWEAGGSTIEWNMVPYDVQLLGGVVLHRGDIAEMKTGEGKTLVATLPIYLNALAGRGVHVVTVNPYLAERDSEWMGPLFEFHGMSVACIDPHPPHSEARRKAYRADVTYGTNNEFGFDYLRDNSFVVDPEQLVQRGHHYAIVDEVDSVLIDEARTPLIISGPVPEGSDQSRFKEFQPRVEKVVNEQKKIVAGFVNDAERLLKERDEALSAGDKKKASRLEDEAGLALLRASRGFQKNPKLRKLLAEPGVEVLMQRTENFYLQDSAKRMPEVDEPLLFALDEKMHAIELTDKGTYRIAEVAGEERDFFTLPDIGEKTVELEAERDRRLAEIDESEEEARAEVRQWFADQKRELYNRYADRAERLHAVEQLLKAYTLYERDDEYIVQEDKVVIVDEHTGRSMEGRRYSGGLHQAIEAKEGVRVQAATQTYATVTLQNFFRLYHKLAGMTGTAVTEAEEFFKIYGLGTIEVPTNRPIARDDKEDLVFKTQRAKFNAVIDKVREYHENGQPVLVGTTSVESSEMLSRLLDRQGIPHNVLNARQDRVAQESEIVGNAGRPGAVTIATNMAGRGTDIKLGKGVKEKGGLAIVGTERHDSRRIDLQLRGRAGRQGDPGASQFYVSLEDDLMRLFGQDRVAKVMDRLNLEEDAVITHPWVTKSLERAQKKVEQNNFGIRKRQLEYDDVLNAQREVIYTRRRNALHGDRFHSDFLDMLYDLVAQVVKRHYGEGDFEALREELLRRLAFDLEMDREDLVRLGEGGTTERIYELALKHYRNKRKALAGPFHQSMQRLVEERDEDSLPRRIVVDFTDGRKLLRAVTPLEEALESQGQEINDALERTAMLSTIDEKWTEHLRELDEVRGGINLRAYGQKDPLIEYKMEAFRLFEQLINEVDEEVVSFVFRAGPLVNQQQDSRQAPKSRLDRRRAQTEHATSNPSYGVKAGGAPPQNQSMPAQKNTDPTEPQRPVVIEDQPGRNDRVQIQNPTTGETKTLKYKHAQQQLNQGWTLIGKA